LIVVDSSHKIGRGIRRFIQLMSSIWTIDLIPDAVELNLASSHSCVVWRPDSMFHKPRLKASGSDLSTVGVLAVPCLTSVRLDQICRETR
jgi:hypothetical protein